MALSEEERVRRKALGRRLRIRRDELGLNMDELVKAAGVSKRAVSDAEQGRVRTEDRVLLAIERALNLPAGWAFQQLEVPEDVLDDDMLDRYGPEWVRRNPVAAQRLAMDTIKADPALSHAYGL